MTGSLCTVDLWPINASPLGTGPSRARMDTATDSLATITSRYRSGRAGIIAGDSSPAASPPHHPTVPVAFVSGSVLPEVPPPPAAEQDDQDSSFWSRLVRSRRPAPRGRHSPKR